MLSRIWARRAIVVSGLLALAASPVYADMGLPMIALVIPASWLLFVPVVLAEAVVASRLLDKDYWGGVKQSAAANAVSTIVGIPVAWILLVVVQMVTGGGYARGLMTAGQRVYAVTVQSPWLIPYEQNEMRWMVPTAGLVLCIPFFFASVVCEYLVMKKLNPGKEAAVKRWAWSANAISYGIIAVLLVGLVLSVLPWG